MSYSHPTNPIDFFANRVQNPSATLSKEAIDIITENFGPEDVKNWVEMDSLFLLALHSGTQMAKDFSPYHLDDVLTWMYLEEGYETIWLADGKRVALNVRMMAYTFD